MDKSTETQENLLLTTLAMGANIIKNFKEKKYESITFNKTYESIIDILPVTDFTIAQL